MKILQKICLLINKKHKWIDSTEEGVEKICSFCGAKLIQKRLLDMDNLTVAEVDEVMNFGKIEMPNLELFNSVTISNSCPNCGKEFCLEIVEPIIQMGELYLTQCKECGERCYKASIRYE